MAARLGHLRDATPDEAAGFFAEVPAEDLVAAVRATSDEELLALIGRPEVRAAAVPGILRRLHEYAVPERLEAVRGIVRFDLERRGTLLERHGLSFTGGALEHLPDLGPGDHADVVLCTSLLRFVRLVSGERNAGLEYLAGTLDIEGDAGLALQVGGLFRIPGSDGVAVDPRSLDPDDVATALKHADAEHVRKVMASGFRPVVLEEIFRRLPDFVNKRKADGLDLTVAFKLEGNPAGEPERYVVRISGGAAEVTVGDTSEARDATITCQAHDFLRLATGQLGAVTGVLRGQLKVRGDKAKALQLSSVVDFPKAR